MLKHTDLRENNFITDGENYLAILNLGDEMIRASANGKLMDFRYDKVFGIPINEDVLTRLDFKLSTDENDHSYYMESLEEKVKRVNRCEVSLEKNHAIVTIHTDDGSLYKQLCEHVHEMQNFWFEKTGTELPVKSL